MEYLCCVLGQMLCPQEILPVAALGANPIGKVFKFEGEAGKPDRPFQVVGLVRDTKYYELREDFPPITFLPKS